MTAAIGTAHSKMITPIGEILITAGAEGLSSIHFAGQWSESALPIESASDAERAAAHVNQACAELRAYFGGTLRAFSVPCVLQGTSFQQSVWAVLRQIPFGEVVSYRAIADRVGNRKAVRAVGGANGHNPIPIIVPCHRVIGSDGSLTGFGGGLDRKQWLLEHEGTLTGRLQVTTATQIDMPRSAGA